MRLFRYRLVKTCNEASHDANVTCYQYYNRLLPLQAYTDQSTEKQSYGNHCKEENQGIDKFAHGLLSVVFVKVKPY